MPSRASERASNIKQKNERRRDAQNTRESCFATDERSLARLRLIGPLVSRINSAHTSGGVGGDNEQPRDHRRRRQRRRRRKLCSSVPLVSPPPSAIDTHATSSARERETSAKLRACRRSPSMQRLMSTRNRADAHRCDQVERRVFECSDEFSTIKRGNASARQARKFVNAKIMRLTTHDDYARR